MKLTKSAALKGALLMVLAANMSWEKIEFGSTELASEAVGGAKTTTAPAATASAPAASTAAPAVVEKVALAPEPAKVTQPTLETEEKVCGEKYVVFFQQIEIDGKSKTEISARRASGPSDKWDVTVPIEGSLAKTVYQKESALRLVTAHVKHVRTKAKLACDTDKAETATTVADKDAGKDDDKEAREEREAKKKEIADRQKSCTVDRNGKTLDKAGKIECLTSALGNIEKRVDKKNADGKRLSEEALSKAALAEIQKIHKELKRLLKSELMSKDESRVEEAKDSIVAAMDAIEESADVFDLGKSKSGRSNNSISKLIGELSALKSGAEAHEEGEKYVERSKEVRDNMRSSYAQALANPLDPYAMDSYRAAQYEYNQLRWDIGNNYEQQFLAPLKRYQSTGLLSAGDYKDFSTPFTDMQKFLREALGTSSAQTSNRSGFSGTITGSVLGSDYAIPTNLAAMRTTSGATSNATRFLGTTGIPMTAPSLSLPALPNTVNNGPTSIFTAPRM